MTTTRVYTRTRGPVYGAYAIDLPAENPEFRIWRLKLGLSQPAVAEALGYHLSTVSAYDTGKRVPDKTAQLAMRAVELNGIEERYATACRLAVEALNLLPAESIWHNRATGKLKGDIDSLTPLAQQIAALDGWGLFDVDGKLELQRDDEANVFADDAAALAHVEEQAAAGSTLHALALALVKR